VRQNARHSLPEQGGVADDVGHVWACDRMQMGVETLGAHGGSDCGDAPALRALDVDQVLLGACLSGQLVTVPVSVLTLKSAFSRSVPSPRRLLYAFVPEVIVQRDVWRFVSILTTHAPIAAQAGDHLAARSRPPSRPTRRTNPRIQPRGMRIEFAHPTRLNLRTLRADGFGRRSSVA
jgi:hypothetical protein